MSGRAARGLAWIVAWCSAEALRTGLQLHGSSPPGRSGSLLAVSTLHRDVEEHDSSGSLETGAGLDHQHFSLGAPLDLHPDAPAEDVGAWLRMSHAYQTLENNMYTPLLVTVQDALEKLGTVTRITDQHGDEAMLAGIQAAVARGRRPLLVDVGTRFGRVGRHDIAKKIVKSCADAGAYVVLYSTEAMDGKELMELTTKLGTDEVWEYALGNIDSYNASFRSQIPVRYMPPGYSPQLDVHVDLNSSRRQTWGVGFMGSTGFRPLNTLRTLVGELGTRFQPNETVWSDEALRQYLEAFPLQLNMHKHQTCCPHNESEVAAMEAFRLAPLLTNKACMISTPAAEKDMQMWEGIVRFAEVNETMQALRDLEPKVLSCQEAAFELFKTRFDPERLLRASGFLDAWRPPSNTSNASA